MSTRAIAPVVGVSGQRVRQIVAEVASDLPPDPEAIDYTTGEVLTEGHRRDAIRAEQDVRGPQDAPGGLGWWCWWLSRPACPGRPSGWP